MVAPKIILFYTSTWKNVIKQEQPTELDMHNFIKALPPLRDYFSCCVCRNMLSGESLFSVELCDHYVCRDCKGLPREDERQLCGNCRDWTDFSEDETLVSLLAGHSRYCRIFLKSSNCTSLLELIHSQSDPGIDVFRILDILQEGAKIGMTSKQQTTLANKFKKEEEDLNPRLQQVLNSHQNSIPSSSTTTRSENNIIKSTAVINICASTSSSITSGSNFSSISPKLVRQKTEDKKKIVQVILQKENNDEDSIDIKIEPVYQSQSDVIDGREDMVEDSEDSSNDSGKSPKDENYLEQEDEEMCSSSEGEGVKNEDDDNIKEEDELDIKEDIEEYSGQVTIPPKQTAHNNPSITTSVSFSIASSSSSPSVTQQQQVIYARATSLPQPTTNTMVQQQLLPPTNLVNTSVSPTPQNMTQISPPRQFHSYVLTRPIASSPSSSQQMHNNFQQFPTSSVTTGVGGVRLQGGQTIRLALPDGSSRPVTIRHVLNQSGGRGSSSIRHITLPINASEIRKKIIVRPAPGGGTLRLAAATTTSTTMQRWPDANAVLQYASGSGAVFSQQIRGPRQHTFTVSQSQMSSMMSSLQNTRPPLTTTSSIPSSDSSSSSSSSSFSSNNSSSKNLILTKNTHTKPIQIATNIYSSSSSSASGSNSPSMNHLIASSSSSSNSSSNSGGGSSSPSPGGGGTTATFTDSAGNIIGTTISLPEALRKTATAKVRIPNKTKPSKIRNGCRCGNAASQPSKLTCCGQRCICYVDGKSCVDCKCRGCNNPYIPGGKKKLLQGLNAVIDTKTNATVSIMSHGVSMMASGSTTTMNFVAASSSSSSSNSHSSSSTMTNNNSNNAHNNNNMVMSSNSPSTTMNLVPMMSPTTHTSMAPHIFTRIHHPGTSQPTTTYSQIIPVANFSGQFGQFTIPLPISLISPANSTMQSHHSTDTIHLQNIQLNPNQLNLQNHNHNQ